MLGEALKNCTPNLKKKKDASIDKFKSDVIKPLKDMIETLVQYFSEISQNYTDKSAVDLVPVDQIPTLVEFMKSLST